jgi:conjugative relaxase-like TrwC/TraI family protein
MISYAVIRGGGNATAVANYLSAVKAAEYYDTGGKLFETYDERIGKIIAENKLETDAQKIEFFKGSKRLGLDMTYSFNKDISLLALLFDREVLETIRETIGWLVKRVNNEFLETRAYDEKGNRIKVPAKGLILTYEHHTSRNLDPQLHYHNFIANKVIRETDGQLTSLEATKLIENTHLLRIETNYRLAYELQNKHGYDAYLDKNGDLRVLDDEELIERFSKRKTQIAEKARELFGTDNLENLSREQVKKLVIATRPTKINEDIETIKDLWRAELNDLGYTAEVFLEKVTLKREEKLNTDQVKEAFELALKYLNRYKGIFKKEELYRNYLINISAVSREANAILPSLEKARTLFEDLIREYGLVSLRDTNGKEYLATQNYIKIEKESLEIFKELATTEQPLFSQEDIEQTIGEYEREKGFKLSADQVNAILTINRTQAVLINGHAGAGKTTAMEVLRRLADKYGYKVIGLAPSGKAAEELSKTLGIGLTIHSFLLNGELLGSLGENTILVIDEAGMVDTRRIYELLTLAKETGAKIILQGDYKQIKPVEAGDFFTDAVSLAKENPKLGYAELTEIRRQKREEYKAITQALSDLDFEAAFKKLIEQKERFFADFDFEKLKEEFLTEPRNSLIVATSNSLKDELNFSIRGELKQKELLNEGRKVKTLIPFEIRYIDDLKEGDEIKFNRKRYKVVEVDTKRMRVIVEELKSDFGSSNSLKEFTFTELYGKNALRRRITELAVGDRVITLKNDKKLGVKNGELFRIVEIKKDGTLVLINDRKKVKLNPKKYPYLDYAYAITVHKSQGMTVKNVLVADRDNRMNRNLFYVAVTRGKENLKIFTNDIVQTLYNAQISQAKVTSFSLQRKKKEKLLTRSQIAEMLILKEPALLEQYRRYIDNWREFNEKLQKVKANKEEKTEFKLTGEYVEEIFKKLAKPVPRRRIKILRLDSESETEKKINKVKSFNNALRMFLRSLAKIEENGIDIKSFAEALATEAGLIVNEVVKLYEQLKSGDLENFNRKFEEAYKKAQFSAVEINRAFKTVAEQNRKLSELEQAEKLQKEKPEPIRQISRKRFKGF